MTADDLLAWCGVAPRPPMIDAVLFDFRGTLFNDEDDTSWVRNSAASIGRSLADAEIAAMLERLGVGRARARDRGRARPVRHVARGAPRGEPRVVPRRRSRRRPRASRSGPRRASRRDLRVSRRGAGDGGRARGRHGDRGRERHPLRHPRPLPPPRPRSLRRQLRALVRARHPEARRRDVHARARRARRECRPGADGRRHAVERRRRGARSGSRPISCPGRSAPVAPARAASTRCCDWSGSVPGATTR